MGENGVAKVLRVIGIAEAAFGIIGGIVIMSNGDELVGVGVAVAIASFITCMLFIGFAEVIDLLQKNVDTQDALLNHMKEKPIDGKVAPKSVLQDIESNLPEI